MQAWIHPHEPRVVHYRDRRAPQATGFPTIAAYDAKGQIFPDVVTLTKGDPTLLRVEFPDPLMREVTLRVRDEDGVVKAVPVFWAYATDRQPVPPSTAKFVGSFTLDGVVYDIVKQ